MYVVHVEMITRPGEQEAMVKTFREVFRPAISKQQGFVETSLLQPLDGKGDPRLTIAFENRELQLKWVATDLHQVVWPKMQSHTSDTVINYYDSV